MIIGSILLSLLSLPLFWLVLPIVVMPPAALYCGWVAFRRAVLESAQPVSAIKKLLYALPMVLAILIFVTELWLMNEGYKA